MERLSLTLRVLLSLYCLTVSASWSTHQPRMIFTDKETSAQRLPLPGHHAPVWTPLEAEQDVVTVVGQTQLYLYNFQHNTNKTLEVTDRPSHRGCSYNITVIHTREGSDQAFLCGTDGKETLCCDMLEFQEITRPYRLSILIPSITLALQMMERGGNNFTSINGKTARTCISHALDIRHMLAFTGLEKNALDQHNMIEQHYVGLMHSRRRDDPLQDRVYAFYKEKNRDTDLHSHMWVPFVAQVCMADIGGPKSKLQLSWTSQLNARLFCGDPDSRQHFSELVDVAIVEASQWQDTRVYGLFRNEWGTSAVCVYLLRDVHHIFTNSTFKGSSAVNPLDRPRTCVPDSTKISFENLKRIEKTSEMEQWVQPVNKSAPLIVNRHKYTRILADSSAHETSEHLVVLILALNNGHIHKLIHTENDTFLVAEYRPFSHHAHIRSITFHPSSRKLYVSTGSELVQLDVQNCAMYGESYMDCHLSRDPYCGWNGTHCIPETLNMMRSEASWNHMDDQRQSEVKMDSIILPPATKHFLRCPVSSHHAQYTWQRDNSPLPCTLTDKECLLLIDSMSPEQAGSYECVSEEMGYKKVLAHYFLELRDRAESPSSSPMIWVCLVALITTSLFS